MPTTLREPIQERAVRTRERLLEAAIDAFASTGYDASATRQIESAAGVKRGLIRYHFGTKDALWRAAASWLFRDGVLAVAETEKATAGLAPVRRLETFVRSFVLFSAARPQIHRLMIREAMVADSRLEWLVKKHVRPWYEHLEKLYAEAVAAGFESDVPFVHFYYTVTGAAALLFAMAPEARELSGIEPTSRRIAQRHADAVVASLFDGRRGPEEKEEVS